MNYLPGEIDWTKDQYAIFEKIVNQAPLAFYLDRNDGTVTPVVDPDAPLPNGENSLKYNIDKFPGASVNNPLVINSNSRLYQRTLETTVRNAWQGGKLPLSMLMPITSTGQAELTYVDIFTYNADTGSFAKYLADNYLHCPFALVSTDLTQFTTSGSLHEIEAGGHLIVSTTDKFVKASAFNIPLDTGVNSHRCQEEYAANTTSTSTITHESGISWQTYYLAGEKLLSIDLTASAIASSVAGPNDAVLLVLSDNPNFVFSDYLELDSDTYVPIDQSYALNYLNAPIRGNLQTFDFFALLIAPGQNRLQFLEWSIMNSPQQSGYYMSQDVEKIYLKWNTPNFPNSTPTPWGCLVEWGMDIPHDFKYGNRFNDKLRMSTRGYLPSAKARYLHVVSIASQANTQIAIEAVYGNYPPVFSNRGIDYYGFGKDTYYGQRLLNEDPIDGATLWSTLTEVQMNANYQFLPTVYAKTRSWYMTDRWAGYDVNSEPLGVGFDGFAFLASFDGETFTVTPGTSDISGASVTSYVGNPIQFNIYPVPDPNSSNINWTWAVTYDDNTTQNGTFVTGGNPPPYILTGSNDVEADRSQYSFFN